MPIHLTVYGQTDVGVVRKTNEDAFVIADLTGGSLFGEPKVTRFEVGKRGVLLAVSDGMGGHQAGEVASALVIESLKRSMAEGCEPSSCDELMEKAAARANREVWEASHHPGREHMGATLTAVFVRDKTAHIAEVGDSRAYLVRAGHVRQVTRDQSYVQFLLDSGGLSPEQAKESQLRNVILQAMGLTPNVKVALGRLELRQQDCFVLCSDGLTNKVTDEELREVILTSRRLDAACVRLIELANKRGGEDNITVILAGVGGDLPPIVPGERISETLVVLQEFDAPTSK